MAVARTPAVNNFRAAKGEMGLRVALGASPDREWVAGVTGVQDREEDPAQLDPVRTGRGRCGDPHGVDSVGDHPIHVALCCRRQLACERPDPARQVELLHRLRTFLLRGCVG